MYECKCCWAPSEDVLCVDCSEFSIFEQIEHKKHLLINYHMFYHTLKHDLENYDLEDVKEMYSYLKEDLFFVLNKQHEFIQRLEEEIKELKLHKDVRLHFLFGIDKDYEFKF
jgi:hypothetical protein